MASNSCRILSIDVESVAIDFTHDGRSPCSVAIVDDKCNIIFSSLIKPAEKVVSDLYPITGLRIKDLEHAPSFEEVVQKIYPLFDSTTIIVGQKPQGDINWLKLDQGIHYSSIIDIAEWFKAYNTRFNSISYFSLAHEALTLLNIDLNAQNGHLATQDAKAAMELYLKYKDNEKEKENARRLLLKTRTKITPSKACDYKYEGVCLAGFFKEKCTCDRPSLADN